MNLFPGRGALNKGGRYVDSREPLGAKHSMIAAWSQTGYGFGQCEVSDHVERPCQHEKPQRKDDQRRAKAGSHRRILPAAEKTHKKVGCCRRLVRGDYLLRTAPRVWVNTSATARARITREMKAKMLNRQPTSSQSAVR